ncbi:MAG: acetoacetate decarboxylase family protein [Haloarculaceae archaeon]
MRDSHNAERTVELSSGHKVTLPLSTTATMVGGVFTASVDAARPMLPDELTPVRLTPARTAVLLLSVEYHRIDRNQLSPYNEFGIFLPAVPGTGTATPLSALGGELGGYTWQLPVTTEPARALGELWQYPKTVGNIAFDDEGRHRRTTVTVDGQRVLTFEANRPRTVPVSLSIRSYTDGDGTVRSVPARVDGRGGAALGCGRTALDLGSHPWADQLRVLGVGPQAIGIVSFEGEFIIDPPTKVE